MHNSLCGACQAVPVVSEHIVKHCPPPHRLLATQSGQARWYSRRVLGRAGAPHCVPLWGAWGSFLLADGTGVCTETQSAHCLPSGPCCTCKHCRVIGSSHMLRAGPGQLGCVYASRSGRVCLCACILACVHE